MLPFARILEYGNIIETTYIKKIDYGISSSFPNMILLSTGDAYIGGLNAAGQLGLGNKTNQYRKLFKINSTKIKYIACSPYSSMYISSDNKIFLAGDRSIQNISGDASGYTTYTDISTLFSTINIGDIKKVVLNYSTVLLMNNGDLYAIGLNRYGEFGLGNTGYTTLTKIATDVLDVSCSNQVVVYMKKDGTVWGAGRNTQGSLQASTDGGVLNANILSFIRLFSTVQEPILHIRVTNTSISAYTSSVVYNKGTNANGVCGDGNNTNTNTNPTGALISTPLLVQCKRSSSLDIVYKTSDYSSMYIGIDNKLYGTGYNSNFSLGLGINTPIVSTFTVVPNITILDTDVLIYGMYNSYIGSRNNIIYGTGDESDPTCMTNDIFTNEFKKLTILPF